MRVRTSKLLEMKQVGEPIVCVTAYDYTMARLVDEAGIPVVLVGDSLGNVVLGYDSTLPVTLDDMLHHTRAVVRGAKDALIVTDMPFMTYNASVEDALRNAGRLLQEGGAQAVKLEGGAFVAGTVRCLTENGIPVMGHLGLTPQSVHQLGGYRVQARTAGQARRLLDDALALEDAGAFSIVLEMVPGNVAQAVTERLTVPTIGIGAGPGCDGQIQVLHDILGLGARQPRHAKAFADLNAHARCAPPYKDEWVRAPSPRRAPDRGRRRSSSRNCPARTADAMRQVETVAALRSALRDAPRPVGLVPTMGALHDGHLALVRAARAECATVVATIFVNPTQFGPGEDLERYPRSLPADLELLEREGVDCVFTPSVEEMYPAGFTTTVHLDGPALPLEGAARPGHFDGVATVVAKLLLQSLPDRAYLGRKDGQQTAVVRPLVARPRHSHRDRRRPHRPRTGRPRHEQPQRLPHAGTARRRARRLPRPLGIPRPLPLGTAGHRRTGGRRPPHDRGVAPRVRRVHRRRRPRHDGTLDRPRPLHARRRRPHRQRAADRQRHPGLIGNALLGGLHP